MTVLPQYTPEEARILLKQLAPLMDGVRIVDPTQTAVLELDETGALRVGTCSCFQTWGREHRCEHCTSMQTMVDGVRKSKYEVMGEQACYVVSWPILLTEGAGERRVVLEVIMNASDLLPEQAGGAQALKQQLEETRLRLYQDDLTQVYNRRYLNEFAFLYRQQDQVPAQVGLILLDLRKFKEVNDTLGHAAGDEILRKVGAALREHVRERDSVIRYGGDEFVVILTGCGPDILPRKVEELRAAVAPVIEANFGWSHTGDFRMEPDFLAAMLGEADAMMYAEKRAAAVGVGHH